MVSNQILFLGDMHIGARKSSPEFHAYFAQSLAKMFEYIDANQIDTIVQVGDMFDVRQHTTTYASDFINKSFIFPCQARGIKVFCLVGNHDAYYKDKISLNSVQQVIGPYNDPNFVIINKPTEVVIKGETFAMFPWVCKETQAETEALLKQTSAKYACGHFEFVGFEYHKGTQSTVGYSHSDYKNFELVISGHYHTSSKKDNVLYTGVPYQLTWVDYMDPKGFWIFNAGDMTFVENSLEMFKVFEYPETPAESDVKNKVCRIRVKQEDSKTKEFIKYKDLIESFNPMGDLKVIETKSLVSTEEDGTESKPTVSNQIKHPIHYVSDYFLVNSPQNKDAVLEEVKSIFENLEKHHDIS